MRKLTDFKNGLEFAKELVRTIGTSKKVRLTFKRQSSFTFVQHVNNVKD